VAPDAEIAADAVIGPLCVVAEGARIGPRVRLIAQVYVGPHAEIGADSLLHPGARVGPEVRIGARCILHPNAVVGADGFSFVTPQRGAAEAARAGEGVTDDTANTRLARIHALGSVRVGDDVEIGAGATVDRGTLADTVIGAGAKLDNLVQIGHNVTVGENVMLCAQSGVAGSSVIGDRAILGGQAGVADHVRVGADTVIGAKSGVGSDVGPRQVMLGAPAVPRDEFLQIVLGWRRLPRLIHAVAALKKRLSEPDGNR
jgi:UDP-3-O-[3-hydroxymyristoyl] glucosamine N-acyltransferase